MLFKVNSTKQNIHSKQGALVVTGNRYVQLQSPLRQMRHEKVESAYQTKGKGGK